MDWKLKVFTKISSTSSSCEMMKRNYSRWKLKLESFTNWLLRKRTTTPIIIYFSKVNKRNSQICKAPHF